MTGQRARISERDDSETRRSAERENQSADILWLNGHNVEQKPNAPGPKRPDYRIDGEFFDNYAPRSHNVRNIWDNVRYKVESGQAPNIVLNLTDNDLTMPEIKAYFESNPIEGLRRLWAVDQYGKFFNLLGDF